jgi:23S rRNA U2552 (ribose-2'-O)-methylase RlmE/FtsJ
MRARLALEKSRVPEIQARIGMKRWNTIVNVASSIEHRNRDRNVINRAYHKMHEISMSCVLPHVTSSVHLCEAPGGFVQCIFDHLRHPSKEWSWRAVTLENGIRVDETRLPSDCGRFIFADVLSDEKRVADELMVAFADRGGVELVTADGAVEMNHDRIEEEHLTLVRAQTRIALQCLRAGGIYVLKVFECLHPATRDFISQLTRHFDFVSLIKPISSRGTNSERYIVCRGLTPIVSPPPTIDDERYVHAAAWTEEYSHIVNKMANEQIQALTRIIESVS